MNKDKLINYLLENIIIGNLDEDVKKIYKLLFN